MEIPRPQGAGGAPRCVGRTNSIEEAERILKRYESEGFSGEIRRASSAGIDMYEIWVSRKPDVFSV